ncbi:adenine-specific DNA-methyltransferase [Dethiosulfatibacter aminovorans DSM 17477]|uniref:site-specific DNA-methyltransferase (adenine-specific) n=1 Tax=Dethiosulfatibacter aminovorans DSM 17477 TaxID=1121476 RepID=A0A1M6D134_9FIRM|nr:N-6 DNA methylase [Dethiosulfatibacter aminovorans]SHI66774.1 adenine-specific DNA-methyltransferase [Dethiosulfatibacter aminovorans DSM 17477]
MSLIKELKTIIKSDPENIDMIRYIVFEYINYFYSEYIDGEKIKSFYTLKEFYSIKGSLSNVFGKTCKKELMTPGEVYEKIIPLKLKKKYGQVYTPSDTVDEMVDEIVDEKEFIENPYISFLDPACGSGYFLVALYKKLREVYDKNEDLIIENHGISGKDIDRHIIENNLMGYDIDGFSCILTTAGINIAGKSLCCPDIRNEDYLFSDIRSKVHAIIGNPPYIGHKNLAIEYKKALNGKFSVYNDKSDISYCFFEKALEELDISGKLLFITSRYFIEGDNARELRKFIGNNYGINRIVDYAGITLFKNTGVSPVIISLVKSGECREVEVVNIPGNSKFSVSKEDLNENPWRLLEKEIESLYGKIISRSATTIGDHFKINQGIITGYDKAFVVSKETIEEYGLEENILVDWLKGSALKKYEINDTKRLKLIYTNDIEIEDFPNTRDYLERFKERLEKRRECRKGYRRWFDLQWGRDRSQFETQKILFPYKSSENRFAIDGQGNYFSADIYMMTGLSDDLNLKECLGYLNSEIFEFLVKVTSKKIGKDLYEYYPYNILKLPYFENDRMGCYNGKNCDNIDLKLYSYLGFDSSEIQLIKKFIKKAVLPHEKGLR